MKSEELFFEIYGKAPDHTVFCPYRICPIGAHTDHNLGKITGFAIDKGVYISYSRDESGTVEMSSAQFEGKHSWKLVEVPDKKAGDWADYLRGASLLLGKKYPLRTGIRGTAYGELPVGGLSSSAAITLAFISALCEANGISLSDGELIDTAHDAESDYVGVPVGKLDQSCEVLCRKDRLLYLDTFDGSFELITAPESMKPYRIAIFFSGLEHALVNSKYGTRVDELRCGVYAVKAYAGLDYGKLAETNAREVPYETYLKYRGRLPEPWRKRCEHWYTEVRRTELGAQAWKNGDIEEFGRLSFESGLSSIQNWESGAPEQIRLYEIMRGTDGIYGGRFSGAGFKGCCLAVIDPKYESSVIENVSKEYLKSFPRLEGKYAAFICGSADGVGTGSR